jgi:glycosyltransferase involved in cell wall biosynthesis
MRICVISRSVGTVVAGGLETYVRQVYSRIADEEEVSIVTGKGDEPEAFTRLKGKLRTYRYPFVSRHNPLSRILTWFGIPIYDDEVEVLSLIPFVVAHLLRNRYDVVIVDNPFLVPVVKALRQRCVFLNQGSIGRSRYFFMRTFRPNLSISCSEFIRRDLLSKFGIDSLVIYNGVNPDEFEVDGSETRKRYRIGKETFILSVGRLVRWKNFHILIEIFSKLSGERKLVIVGDGVERENLEKLAEDLGVRDRVVFTGVVDRKRMPQLFAACDVFVLMSMGEAFGVVYAEAMAAGKPVVTYDMGAAPEIMDSSFSLLLKEKDTVEQMAGKVGKFLKRDLRAMGKLARRRAEDFSWHRIAKQTLDALRSRFQAPSP